MDVVEDICPDIRDRATKVSPIKDEDPTTLQCRRWTMGKVTGPGVIECREIVPSASTVPGPPVLKP